MRLNNFFILYVVYCCIKCLAQKYVSPQQSDNYCLLQSYPLFPLFLPHHSNSQLFNSSVIRPIKKFSQSLRQSSNQLLFGVKPCWGERLHFFREAFFWMSEEQRRERSTVRDGMRQGGECRRWAKWASVHTTCKHTHPQHQYHPEILISREYWPLDGTTVKYIHELRNDCDLKNNSAWGLRIPADYKLLYSFPASWVPHRWPCLIICHSYSAFRSTYHLPWPGLHPHMISTLRGHP